MNKNLRVCILTLLFSMILICTTYANNSENFYCAYYLDELPNGDFYIKSMRCYYDDDLNNEERVKFILDNLIDNAPEIVNYIPDGTELLDVKIDNSHLILNFNSNLKNYGGSHYELAMIRQILFNVFEIKEISEVTILIKGKSEYLAEGSLVYKYDREELKN